MRLNACVRGMACACAVLALLAAATPVWAQGQRQATVKVKDGRTVTGLLVGEDDKAITLEISGIRTPIQRDQIESVEYLKSVDEEYAARRAQLAENDLDGRYDLALWLYQREAYDLSMKELEDLTQRFPDDGRVTILRNAVAGRIKLLEDQQTDLPPDATPPGVTPTPTPRPVQRDPAIPAGLPDEKLTQEQINLIRLYEVDLSTKPVVIVPRDVIDELFDKHKDSDLVPKGRSAQSAFRSAKGYEQLDLIFRLRAREFYPRITVKTDPPAITAFRTQLHQQYVLSYCASNGCHGDASGGDLFLFRTSPNSDPTVFTNFFILHRYQTPQHYMLDRDQPEASLLLQYGMARDLAKTPHPEVPGYNPQIRVASDPRIKMITDFVNQLYKPAPTYGISFTPPTPGKKAPAEAPDEAPATAPEDAVEKPAPPLRTP